MVMSSAYVESTIRENYIIFRIDSEIVLHIHPHYKPLSQTVSEIQDLTDKVCWRLVLIKQNPADQASLLQRGRIE